MEAAFWHERWHQEQIAFHQERPHPMLTEHVELLAPNASAKILVPLCGKSLDMLWLAQQGYSVLGVELSDKACKAFFSENRLAFSRHPERHFVRYEAEDLPITLLMGDVFDLNSEHLAKVEAIYDRAATIALPKPMREQYWQHLSHHLPEAVSGLVISIDDEDVCHEGPPFSVPEGELQSLVQPLGTLHTLVSAKTLIREDREPLETLYQLRSAK